MSKYENSVPTGRKSDNSNLGKFKEIRNMFEEKALENSKQTLGNRKYSTIPSKYSTNQELQRSPSYDTLKDEHIIHYSNSEISSFMEPIFSSDTKKNLSINYQPKKCKSMSKKLKNNNFHKEVSGEKTSLDSIKDSLQKSITDDNIVLKYNRCNNNYEVVQNIKQECTKLVRRFSIDETVEPILETEKIPNNKINQENYLDHIKQENTVEMTIENQSEIKKEYDGINIFSGISTLENKIKDIDINKINNKFHLKILNNNFMIDKIENLFFESKEKRLNQMLETIDVEIPYTQENNTVHDSLKTQKFFWPEHKMQEIKNENFFYDSTNKSCKCIMNWNKNITMVNLLNMNINRNTNEKNFLLYENNVFTFSIFNPKLQSERNLVQFNQNKFNILNQIKEINEDFSSIKKKYLNFSSQTEKLSCFTGVTSDLSFSIKKFKIFLDQSKACDFSYIADKKLKKINNMDQIPNQNSSSRIKKFSASNENFQIENSKKTNVNLTIQSNSKITFIRENSHSKLSQSTGVNIINYIPIGTEKTCREIQTDQSSWISNEKSLIICQTSFLIIYRIRKQFIFIEELKSDYYRCFKIAFNTFLILLLLVLLILCIFSHLNLKDKYSNNYFKDQSLFKWEIVYSKN